MSIRDKLRKLAAGSMPGFPRETCEEAIAELDRLALLVAAADERDERMASGFASQFNRVCTERDNWRITANAKQAQIDRLMLEFCPGEMTASQREEWARNQAPIPETDMPCSVPGDGR